MSEPLADWEREFLNKKQYEQDAWFLRNAAEVLRRRCGFTAGIIPRALDLLADRLMAKSKRLAP